MKLYGMYHDRTRPHIYGMLVSIGKCCSIKYGGIKRRVSKKDLVRGKYNPKFLNCQGPKK